MQRGLHARDIAVMIGAPDVDAAIKSAPKFIVVIYHVAGQIRAAAVFAHDDAVFFVAYFA